MATDCDYGPRELITNETGRLVPKGDVTSIADAMYELLTSDGLTARLGSNAKRFVEANYSTNKIVQQWTKVLTEAAGRGDIL